MCQNPRTFCFVLAALIGSGASSSSARQATSDGPLEETLTWVVEQPVQKVNTLDAVTLGPAQAGFNNLLKDDDLPNNALLTETALASRLGAQLLTVELASRMTIVEFLAEHHVLAAELAFLLTPRDDHAAAYEVLARLIDAHGDDVGELAPLAAAICVVHDQPLSRTVNENTVPGIDPVALFGYYADHKRSMHFSLTDSAAPLLVHLADATGSIEEYEWARRRYARDQNVGNRYQEINYDSRAFTQDSATKRVNEADGYTLQAIRQHGGVCADQAYFALSVGKAIGVPACYVRGRGGDVSHAWVGFLERSGRRSVRWNFSEGRYESFEDVQGRVVDPQHGESVPDAFLTILSSSNSIEREDRHRSLALLDAARRLSLTAWHAAGRDALTEDLTERQLGLLRESLRIDPGNLQSWLLARDILASPTTPVELKHDWTRAVDQMAGVRAPDFAMEMLAPIFAAEADPAARFGLWEWAAGRFRSRPDLAARARVEQARALEEQGRQADAARAYHAVFEQFPEAGPVSVASLADSARILNDLGRGDEVPALYQEAWKRLRAPRRTAGVFLRQTSWYRVGDRYAELLEELGDDRAAASIRRKLDR